MEEHLKAWLVEGDDDDDLFERAAVLLAMEVISDEEDEFDEINSGPKWGGSTAGKAPNKRRNFKAFYEKIVNDYFSGDDSVFNEGDFERRFRVPRVVFDRVWQQLNGQGCFIQKHDALGKAGIHPLIKMVSCFRKLAYGDACDREDENLGVAESTLSQIFKEFAKSVKREFPQYLHRSPTEQEIARSQAIYEARGFPGCFASWDCKHFQWKNCPVALAGQFRGKEGKSTLVLEAICDGELYIWHSFFGEAGSLNDINILDKSSIVFSLINGSFSLRSAPYRINNTDRDWLYFLVDGIYPPWAIFVDSFHGSIEEKQRNFSMAQEAARKDIERCFGVLVQRFQILSRPLRHFYWEDTVDLLDCCIILHNMVVENRRSEYNVGLHEYAQQTTVPLAPRETDRPPVTLFGSAVSGQETADLHPSEVRSMNIAALTERLKNPVEHHSLKNDLVEHLWARKQGDSDTVQR